MGFKESQIPSLQFSGLPAPLLPLATPMTVKG